MPIVVMVEVGLNKKIGLYGLFTCEFWCLRVGGTELSIVSVGMKAFGCPSSIMNVWGIFSSDKK